MASLAKFKTDVNSLVTYLISAKKVLSSLFMIVLSVLLALFDFLAMTDLLPYF